jgi:hypothetical protein
MSQSTQDKDSCQQAKRNLHNPRNWKGYEHCDGIITINSTEEDAKLVKYDTSGCPRVVARADDPDQNEQMTTESENWNENGNGNGNGNGNSNGSNEDMGFVHDQPENDSNSEAQENLVEWMMNFGHDLFDDWM